MLLGTCAMAAFGPSGSLMTMTHKGHYNAWVAIASLPLAAGLLYALVPTYGGLGAAVAISGALIVRTLAQAWAAEIHLKEMKLKI
jgi:O-antigen/teichoic acid export membrane protein